MPSSAGLLRESRPEEARIDNEKPSNRRRISGKYSGIEKFVTKRGRPPLSRQRLSADAGAGLVHLKGLTILKKLSIFGSRVTAAGVKQLQQALPNCYIEH